MAESGRINHRQLADICGVSTATISRALSGHPSVREAVREKILKEAERHGYQRDPRLAYLSRLRWSQGRSGDSVKLAVLVDRFTEADPDGDKLGALRETARELGYALEFQRVEPIKNAGARISREYYHRGIQGILIALHSSDSLPELDWDKFTVVMVGEEYPGAAFHRVGTDWRQGFDLLTSKVLPQARRVGFVLTGFSGGDHPTGQELSRDLLAEVLLHREEVRQAGKGDIPLFQFDPGDPDAATHFVDWVLQYTPDTAICTTIRPGEWLATGMLPVEAPRLVCLPWSARAGELGLSGCSLQLGKRLSLALRQLHQNLLLDQRGFNSLPTKTLVPLRWEEPR